MGIDQHVAICAVLTYINEAVKHFTDFSRLEFNFALR